MGSQLCDHLASLCVQCDWKLHSKTVNNYEYSRIPLCYNCVSQTAVVQCQGLCLCQTCYSHPNIFSRLFLLRYGSNNNSAYSCDPVDLDFDSSSSSCSSSFFDRNYTFSFGSLPENNEDSSSSFETFQIDEYYTKSDQQVPMLQPDYLDIPNDSSCSGFNGSETKEDIENILPKTFNAEEAFLYPKEYNPDEELILTDQLIDELTNVTKHNAETTSTKILSSSSLGMPSVIDKDYNIEDLADANSQDYYINQMIGSKAKEETNNLAIFPNALVQLDCGQSQLILTDEMLPWENQTFVPVSRYGPQAREEALKRYFAKKKKRKFGKQIRYESRKSTADTKRRMKGRFTKAGAEFDYDPRANNIKKGTNRTMS